MSEVDASIILTVRNVEPTIRLCLDSILAQRTTASFEVIVVEALSTDATLGILMEYAGKDSRVRVISRRSTQPEALNLAVREARAPVLAFIDGDCRADEGWLQELLDHVHRGDALVGGIVLTPAEIGGLGRVIGYDLDFRFLATKSDHVKRHPNMNLAGRREVFEKIAFNEKLPIGYDTDFGYRAGAAGHKIRFARKALVYHYHRSTWRAFVRQQSNSVRFFLRTPKATRPRPTRDDNINPWWMQLQPPALGITVLGVAVFFLAPMVGAAILAFGLVPFVYPAVVAATVLRRPGAALALLWFYPARTAVWLWAYASSRGGARA